LGIMGIITFHKGRITNTTQHTTFCIMGAFTIT
jgi:hypothetical protein